MQVPRTWGNVYLAMQVEPDADELPLFSYVHRGEAEKLLMSKVTSDGLIALRVWLEETPSKDMLRGTLTRHKRDTDLYIFNHWGYVATQKDKSELTSALKGSYFINDKMADESLRIIQKRK